MNPLTVVYLAALVGGSAAAVAGLLIARSRRRVFFTAAALFTVSAVLAMWSIGITHVPLAVGCLIAGLMSKEPTSQRQQGRAPDRRRLGVGLVLLAALLTALATASMLRFTPATETRFESPPAPDAVQDT